MYHKYFVWNIDDGLEQDKKIIQILKKYNMGATFNLNSGLYGEKTMIGRIGNLGMSEVPIEKFKKSGFHLLPYAEHFRIPENEVVKVYEGFEIASHSLEHKNMKQYDEAELRRQILDDVKNLNEKFQQKTVGFVYPYGAVNDACIPLFKEAGIEYARVVGSDTSFRFPSDPYQLPLTCWHIKKNALDLINQFIAATPTDDDMFFLMFAHGYEFDFGTKESNWVKLEKICQKVSSAGDIICCSTRDAFEAHRRNQK